MKKRKQMRALKPYLFIALLLITCLKLLPFNAQAADFFSKLQQPSTSDVHVCFTPGGACTSLITSTIAKAEQQILVQAYQLTAKPIAQALFAAKTRGVDVRVILDKSQLRERYAMICQLLAHGIPVLIDDKPAIAHNKIMIIDAAQIITGSFNFTNSAQYHNAENLLVISNKNLAQQYINNWRQRAYQSIALNSRQVKQLACQKPIRKYKPRLSIV
jgi:phosphatidylserine/phosphatidylglycerophosphate/cardiolipin synthase-like enzyme